MVGVINRLPTLGVLLAVAVIAVNLYDMSRLACVYTCRIWDICQWCVDPAGEICSVPYPMPLVSCFFSTISFLGFRASSQDHQAHLLRRSVSFALAAVEISGPENIQKPQKMIKNEGFCTQSYGLKCVKAHNVTVCILVYNVVHHCFIVLLYLFLQCPRCRGPSGPDHCFARARATRT